VLVLLSLDEGPKSIGALAEQVGADPPYVTLVVNELEALGMLTRGPRWSTRSRRPSSSS
jgi:DNA-binding MarR family transcriptional regulator